MAQKGIDYYIDPISGKYVMTEKWLAQRGFCCNALPRCRHCPWHPQKAESEFTQKTPK